MSIDELLENRHTTEVEWGEHWPATGPEGNDISAHVTLKATVHDCVNLARSTAKAHGMPTMGNDAEFLLDFIAVHWANVVAKNEADQLRAELAEVEAVKRRAIAWWIGKRPQGWSEDDHLRNAVVNACETENSKELALAVAAFLKGAAPL